MSQISESEKEPLDIQAIVSRVPPGSLDHWDIADSIPKGYPLTVEDTHQILEALKARDNAVREEQKQ